MVLGAAWDMKIRELMMTKKVNFLLGSGTSVPGIPLMSQFKSDNCNESQSNNLLLQAICERSKKILELNSVDIENTQNDEEISDLVTTRNTYIRFVRGIISILYLANSREVPRVVNIFTTNYDLFLESAIDHVMKSESFVFNDGARGYFDRELESSNFNQVVSYRGLNNNYINEIPSITLIKPHGSVNWKRKGNKLLVENNVVENPAVVLPDHHEEQQTFMDNHFHEMLRVFQLELDKPQSVLMVIGFSFQDQHIAKMIRRALRNKELLIICFCYDDNYVKTILKNLQYGSEELPNNLKIKRPSDFLKPKETSKKTFVLSDLIELLSVDDLDGDWDDDE